MLVHIIHIIHTFYTILNLSYAYITIFYVEVTEIRLLNFNQTDPKQTTMDPNMTTMDPNGKCAFSTSALLTWVNIIVYIYVCMCTIVALMFSGVQLHEGVELHVSCKQLLKVCWTFCKEEKYLWFLQHKLLCSYEIKAAIWILIFNWLL